MNMHTSKIMFAALLGAVVLISTPNRVVAQCIGDDCLLLTGQYWKDITDTTDEFNIDCEYRWKVSNLNVPHGMMFYSTVTSHNSLTVEWGGGIVLNVNNLDKGTSSGNYHSGLVARTFERCPNELP